MWIKILVSAAVVAFCVFLGYWAAWKYRARKRFYNQFCTFNERYLTELTYARKPLGEFLKAYSYTGDFQKMLTTFSEKRTVEQKLNFLTKEEQGECGNYLSMLGKGDALSQKNYFSAFQSTLTAKKADSEKQAKSHGELYLKLGLLAGLAIVILIV